MAQNSGSSPKRLHLIRINSVIVANCKHLNFPEILLGQTMKKIREIFRIQRSENNLGLILPLAYLLMPIKIFAINNRSSRGNHVSNARKLCGTRKQISRFSLPSCRLTAMISLRSMFSLFVVAARRLQPSREFFLFIFSHSNHNSHVGDEFQMEVKCVRQNISMVYDAIHESDENPTTRQ